MASTLATANIAAAFAHIHTVLTKVEEVCTQTIFPCADIS
jgi:hypothetical protein